MAVFPSTSDAMRAEKTLKRRAIPAKLIPVPRQISWDCGVCLRFNRSDEETVKEALAKDKVRVEAIVALE